MLFNIIRATEAQTHLEKSKGNLKMNHSCPNHAVDQKQQLWGSAAQKGGLKLLLYSESLHMKPLEDHYGSTVLFTVLINNSSQRHSVLHCPNLHKVWAFSACEDRGQSRKYSQTLTLTQHKENYKQENF